MQKHIRITRRGTGLLILWSLWTGSVLAQQPVISDAGGWLETVWAEWQAVEGAEGYRVYLSGEGHEKHPIDDQLIRDYGTHLRADVPGLRAGSYTLEVRALTGGQEGAGTLSSGLVAEAHDRSGFAFSNDRCPGAYSSDGTPRPGAVVLYLTENTKNTMSLEVEGANENPCVGLQAILDGFKKGKDKRPLIIRLVGQVTDPEQLNKGDIVIENDNNSSGSITLEGLGRDAVADGWGIRVKNASNIEIRNLAIMNCNSDEGDNISLQQDNEHIWIHHVDFFYGDPGGDADQAKGDGALDSKRSGFVTISYNHFWDSGKSNLLGNGTEEPRYLSYHHNWYDHSDSRHPRVRSHSVHVYNNYYDGNAKYGVGATLASSVFVEANYFRNCRYPMLISMQGSDVFDASSGSNDYNDMPTFSKEDGGSIKAWNNHMEGQERFVAWGDAGFPDATVDFDAWVASSRDEQLPASVLSARGGNAYNNFDTDPSLMYSYTADSPAGARDRVLQYAGRMDGGDFTWTFDNAADDASYLVHPGLKEALASYATSLVAIQGDGEGIGQTYPDSTVNPGDTTTLPPGGMIHNFTESGLDSYYFDISGNLSDSKGTVLYRGLELTRCLKIESSTRIAFSCAEASVLELVFNGDFNGRIRIDGSSRSASGGLLSLELEAGQHEISKEDVAMLYYMHVQSATSRLRGETGRKDEFLAYPNPAGPILYLESPVPILQVILFSPQGKVLRLLKGHTSEIDLGGLQDGYFLLQVQTTRGTHSRKILRAREP